jgi:hypothetical protein
MAIKFRPKRSDFGRKKLRTAETGVGFRLSEVIATTINACLRACSADGTLMMTVKRLG